MSRPTFSCRMIGPITIMGGTSVELETSKNGTRMGSASISDLLLIRWDRVFTSQGAKHTMRNLVQVSDVDILLTIIIMRKSLYLDFRISNALTALHTNPLSKDIDTNDVPKISWWCC